MSGVQIVNPLMWFIPWNQANCILEPRTHENKPTGLDHFWGIMANKRGDGRMKKVNGLIFGHWALRKFANSSSQQEALQASPSKLASLPFVKDQGHLTESLLHIRLCSKHAVWILSFKSHNILGTSLVAQWLWLWFQCRGRGFNPWLGN